MAIKCPKCHSDNTDTARFCSNCATALPSRKEIPVTETLEIPTEELTRGTTFASRYEIIEELGKGGMGKVYRVEDKKIKEEVALKLIKPEIASDKKTIERFSNELKMARKIAHRNVCKMYDLGEEKGAHYITMEYVPGQDLRGLIKQTGQLAVGTTINISKQVCEGLAEAHRLGVVHRDLKPQNIMIDKEGNARIMDFGIARSIMGKGITGAGVMIGTPEYMSPEQVEGKEVDQRSDIYSLGVILYEMVTGRVPFEGDTPFTIGVKHKSEMPKDPKELNTQLPEDLNLVILRCLEKDKENRYQSAGEVRSELSRIEKGIPTTERVVPKREPKTVKIGEIKWKSLILYAGAAVLLISLIVIGRNIFFPGHHEAIDSIAVLPMANLSGDPEQEYFADGMTEALIANLGKIGALRVISRQSVMRYKGSDKPLPEIARELNVDAVVEGSVLRAGEQVRITAQLIGAVPERHLWAESYERDMGDVLALQREVARAIAREIKVAVTPEEATRLASARRVNPEAYEAYLKGRSHEYRISPEDFDKALDYFNLALEKDPDYAPAYTGIANVWGARGCFGFVPPGEASRKVKAAVLKALELDDMLAEGHEILGRFRFGYEWDWPAAEREFQRAIGLNPNNAYVRFGYWWFLSCMKRPAEAQAQIERALELDPFNSFFQNVLGRQLLYGRRYDDAIEQFRKALATEPNFAWAYSGLWSAFHQKGMTEEALAEAKQFLALTGNREVAEAMEHGHAEAGYRVAMIRGAEKLVAQAELRYVQPIQIARLYAHAKGKDLALDWLERAYEVRDPFLIQLSVDLDWDSLRDDPRFQALLRRMNFPE